MRDISPPDRPREKIEERGAIALTDQELIAAILGNGIPGRDIMDISREVASLLSRESRPTGEQLMAINGIGQSKACILLACFEIGRRYAKPEEEPVIRITAPADLLAVPEAAALRTRLQEHFLVITLNGASEVIHARTVTKGLVNNSLVHPREVFADAIADRAAAVICAHNHPSGNLEPSSQDIQVTRQLAEAGEILGIPVIDHVIISKKGIVSLRESGYL